MRTSITLLLILAFLIASSTATPLPAKAEPKTIVVPDDYPTVQAAIDNANAGDTVFVKKGTYLHDGATYGGRIDGITIDKPISLIGEDSKTTILKPNYTSMNVLRSGIHVTADNVTISGFTIHGTVENVNYKNTLINFTGYQQTGIFVHTTDNVTPDPYGCKIIGNIFTGNGDYSVEDHGISSFISENTMTEGISLVWSSNTVVSGNNIGFNGKLGIGLYSCVNVRIKQNNIIGSISLGNTGDGYIYENNITDGDFGIIFMRTNNCFVYNNNIMRNKIGIFLPNQIISPRVGTLGTGNRVYYNNLMNNEENVLVETAYRYPPDLNETDVIGNGTDVVSWDNGLVGNYWSDYSGQGAYVIDENNVDRHPLTQQVDISTTALELSTILVTIAIIIVIVVGIGILFYFKKRKR
jgi:hypothetical protein